MSDFFTFGPTGHGVAVDASGRVVAHDGRATGSHIFGYGDTGRPLLVDDMGRLLISIQSASGVSLPDPSLYNFGDKFYVTGSGATNIGFYIRGISNWESTTTVVASGEANTASNLAGGVGLYGSKAGADLRFKSLLAGSGIKLTAATNTVRIDVDEAIDTPITDAGGYYASDNIEDALQTAGLKNKNFSDASGTFAAGIIVATGVRTDFDNASGIMNDAIALATQNTTDFVNSSGIFQAKVASISSAGGTTMVKAATGVLKGLTAGTGVILTGGTNDVVIDVKDFANASGLFAKTTTVVANQKNFTDASGLWVKSAASAGGMSVVKTGTAPALSFKGLVAGSGLAIKSEANTLTIANFVPSGGTLPNPTTVPFGTNFYHHVSGFYRKGQYIWELQTNMHPHTSQWWQDTTPAGGTPTSLPTAFSYVRFSSIQASGGAEPDHGIQVTTSGIKILDDESAGRFSVFWNVSYEGTANTTYYGALFRNTERIRASQCTSRLGGTADIQLMSSRAIIDLAKNDELLLKFAAGANSKTINIFTMNVSLTRIAAKNQTLAP